MQNPASVDLNSGKVDIYKAFGKLKKPIKKFVIAHEKAHFVYQTTDEVQADRIAINSIKKTATAKDFNQILTYEKQLLKRNSGTNCRRLHQLKLEALRKDYIENGNILAYNILEKMKKSAYRKKRNFEGIETASETEQRMLAKGMDIQGNQIARPEKRSDAGNTNSGGNNNGGGNGGGSGGGGSLPDNNKKSIFTTKNIIIALVVIVVLYFVYIKFLKS